MTTRLTLLNPSPNHGDLLVEKVNAAGEPAGSPPHLFKLLEGENREFFLAPGEYLRVSSVSKAALPATLSAAAKQAGNPASRSEAQGRKQAS